MQQQISRLRRALLATAVASLLPAAALAQGVTADTILIGQSTALKGAAAQQGIEFKAGAEAYFNVVNEAGGIGGRKIKLTSLDDANEPAQAKANAQKLAGELGVLAVFGMSGAHTVAAALPILEKNKVVLFAPADGDQFLREPLNRYVFNIRAGYYDEVEQIVGTLTRRGLNKIAVFYQNDASGRAGLAAVETTMRARKLTTLVYGSVNRHGTNVTSAAQTISKSGAQAVIIAAGAVSAAPFIAEMKKLGSNASFALVSSTGATTLAKLLGDDSRGVEVSQVVPLPYADGQPLGRDYIKDMGGADKVSFSSLEGYIAARVLVEGIRKAGKTLSRESLIDALEKLGTLDLRGYRIAFSPTNHNGSTLVNLTIIGKGGVYKN
jgi:branched-chain amino acid transport system substrate-binding protein